MNKIIKNVKEVVAKVIKSKPVEEAKEEVCTNCNASGLKCSVCGAGSMV